ncbi:DUF2214 domain-containing protein [Ancylobacter dichloromethanicus]|uniref:DUF6644 domain-containing protein n=1 Tax=Ancylobacter dichloromethanicus TaxID=518825 RepID=A0A9W6N1L7_9HYPH|nr:DUF6644 family protein [Ancylobacter dichloromethanicus]MBS7552417.1 DUF2214 domain-containing protein [Ancylobacter dichloromethanicus]GLK74157.1 hypothetical protein GCM10017643_42750 [Ancylobacter dichloromethanicus]
MEELSSFLAALAGWPGARWLRASWIAYLLVNAAHILGVAVLLGSILVLDLRLLGGLRQVPLAVIGPLHARVAAGGAGLAILTGLWLFTVRPAEYAENPAFQIKLALLAAALTNVAVQHANPAYRQALRGGALTVGVRASATASALLWLAALVAGRWIGFA